MWTGQCTVVNKIPKFLLKLKVPEKSLNFCLSNAILTDYLITLVSVRVCVSVHRSVVERLRLQFFTDFHQILHAAQKCGCFERYCFSDKPEVVYRF